MNQRRVFVTALTLIVVACGDSEPPRTDEPAVSVPDAPETPALNGLYVWGAEVNTFQPCGSDVVYWVHGDQAESLRLGYQEWWEEERPEPYSAMFATLRGEPTNEEPDGFAEQYDGLFRVDELIELRPVRAGDCDV